MVWEQLVLLVVMTTRTVERNRIKCGQYWPTEEGDEEIYDDAFSVANCGSETFDGYVMTSLQLKNLHVCHDCFPCHEELVVIVCGRFTCVCVFAVWRDS